MLHESGINHIGAKPLLHFLKAAFKEHHVDVGILLVKMSEHSGEQRRRDGRNATQSQIALEQPACSPCSLLKGFGMCQQGPCVWKERAPNTSQCDHALVVALKQGDP